MSSKSPRLYFAYGSNLSLAQMKSRCPGSGYYALGLLKGYKWIIGERGYANVIKTSNPKSQEHETEEHVIYGMLYTLEDQDEENLDIAEGVPYAYSKRELDIELVSKGGARVGGSNAAEEVTAKTRGKPEVVEALVYVDEKRLGEGICKEEYVGRMNRGITDAVGKGMDKSWVQRVIRPFVREEEVNGEVGDPFHPSNVTNGEAYEDECLDDEGDEGDEDSQEMLAEIERGGRNGYQEL